MFYVNCRFCHIPIEISGTNFGPDCRELRNVCHCRECDEQFFFDACEVDRKSLPETARSPTAYEAEQCASSVTHRCRAEIEIVLPLSDESSCRGNGPPILRVAHRAGSAVSP